MEEFKHKNTPEEPHEEFTAQEQAFLDHVESEMREDRLGEIAQEIQTHEAKREATETQHEAGHINDEQYGIYMRTHDFMVEKLRAEQAQLSGSEPTEDELTDISEAGAEADELSRVNDTLRAIEKTMQQLNRQRQSGEITQQEYQAKYEPLVHNDLEYFTAKKARLEAALNPPESSGIRKMARGVMGLFQRKKD